MIGLQPPQSQVRNNFSESSGVRQLPSQEFAIRILGAIRFPKGNFYVWRLRT